MKNYNLTDAKALVINGMIHLVTPNIKHCLIKCIISRSAFTDAYKVSIGSYGPKHGRIRLGKAKTLDVVKRVFNQATMAIVHLEYNGHRYAPFSDL